MAELRIMLTNWKSSGSNQEQKGLVLTKYYFCIRQDLFVPEALQLVVRSKFLELVRWVAAQGRCEPRRDAWPNDLLVLKVVWFATEISVNLEYHKKTRVLILPMTGGFSKLVNNVSKSIYSLQLGPASYVSKLTRLNKLP